MKSVQLLAGAAFLAALSLSAEAKSIQVDFGYLYGNAHIANPTVVIQPVWKDWEEAILTT